MMSNYNDPTDVSPQTLQARLMNMAAERMGSRFNSPDPNQNVQRRNTLMDQYEAEMVNRPASPSPLDTGFNRMVVSGGRGAGAVGSAFGQANLDWEAQKQADWADRLKTIQNAQGMRSKAVTEDDSLLRSNILKSTLGGANKPVVKMDKDGNMVLFDPVTNETKVVHSSQRGEYQRIWQKAYQSAVSEGMTNPEEYAHQTAIRVLGGSPAYNPQAKSPETEKPQVLQLPKGARPEAEALIIDQFRKALALYQNPETRAQGSSQLEALKQLYPKQAESGLENPTIQYKDLRSKEQEKSYGGEEGKKLFIERQDLDSLYGANSKLMGQLNTLEKIYSNPNIPQGQLADYEQSLRSGLKTLGVEVAPETGITDFAKAIGTSLALTQKNADGKNLLPGAMSNYEDQLLQKMAPTLSLTSEGRMALIQFMKQVAQANLRLSGEATKLASENNDMLPASWYKRKERVMLEEMARMKEVSDQLVNQYGGKR